MKDTYNKDLNKFNTKDLEKMSMDELNQLQEKLEKEEEILQEKIKELLKN